MAANTLGYCHKMEISMRKQPTALRLVMAACAYICFLASVSGWSGLAWGQDYPVRPITLVAPSTPGSTPDILARIIGRKLSEQLGQQVVVINRPGAGNNIGTASVAQAAPDGYTILLG